MDKSSAYNVQFWEKLPQAAFPFVGSDEILKSVFDAIDRQVFNGNLNGIKLEWCDKLKSRAIIAYEQSTFSTKQTYIRCSKAWFDCRNRKQFVEAVLYELIQLYMLKSKTDASYEDDPNLVAYLLKGAVNYFNTRYETNLTLNNNYNPDGDNEDINNILISIADERSDSNRNWKRPPTIKLLTEVVTGNEDAVKCGNSCGGICYASGCHSAIALRERFLGTNIYFIFALEKPQCFLCEEMIEQGGLLGDHFEKDCNAFGRPKTEIF